MEPITIQDTAHMAQFVHQFYTQNIDTMKSTYQEQMKDFIAAQKVGRSQIEHSSQS
jgi:hypothetical protein